jgi:hypothetical protein
MANRAHLKRQFLNTWFMCVAYLDRITIRHSLYVGIWDLAYLGKYNLNWITRIFHHFLLFGNDNLSVEINTFIFSCVQKYIKDTRRFSWTNKSTCNIIDNCQHCVLLHVRIFFSWSHLGYWLIDMSQVDEIYMCYSVQIVLTYVCKIPNPNI